MKVLPAGPSFMRRLRAGGGRAVRVFDYERLFALVLLMALACVMVWDPLPVESLRLKLFDAYQVVQPRVTRGQPVTIVDIDEASLKAFGQWPWPRSRMAQLVDALRDLGARVVGFDIVFAEPDRLSPGLIADAVPNLDDAVRAKLKALPSTDDVFAAALRQTRAVLGQTAVDASTASDPALPRTGMATLGPSALPHVVRYPGILTNVPVLEQAAAGRGLFTIVPERDGVVRRVPMVLAAEGRLVPSLTLELLRVVTGAGAILVKTVPRGILQLELPGFRLPTDPKGQIWIHFTPHQASRFVSVKDVLDGTARRERIAGKIVLVGTSALGLLDSKTTPLTRSMPGVEIHAQVLESALTGNLLHEPPFARAMELAIAMLVGLVIVALAPLLGPVLLLMLGATVTATVAGASWWSYSRYDTLVDASFPLVSSFVVFAALAFTNYVRAQLGRRRIRSAFSQYLSPDLVAELARSSEALALGGETRRMSIMFSDVRGFTSIAESYRSDPQGLTRLMNSFLTPLTNAILGCQGTIDKYMGDAIMAFWNAPLPDADQETNACKAALDMLARLDVLNAARHAAGEAPPLDIGIGINTGPCVVGNMGSDLRFDYSVLGDTVNLASRIEAQSKTYGIKIILGDATARAVETAFAVLEIDLLQVKGKSEPEPVWALLGGSSLRNGTAFRELTAVHLDFLKSYRTRAFDDAAHSLKRCQALGRTFGLDTLYALFDERIAAFLIAPPPDGWTGTHIATSK